MEIAKVDPKSIKSYYPYVMGILTILLYVEYDVFNMHLGFGKLVDVLFTMFVLIFSILVCTFLGFSQNLFRFEPQLFVLWTAVSQFTAWNLLFFAFCLYQQLKISIEKNLDYSQTIFNAFIGIGILLFFVAVFRLQFRLKETTIESNKTKYQVPFKVFAPFTNAFFPFPQLLAFFPVVLGSIYVISDSKLEEWLVPYIMSLILILIWVWVLFCLPEQVILAIYKFRYNGRNHTQKNQRQNSKAAQNQHRSRTKAIIYSCLAAFFILLCPVKVADTFTQYSLIKSAPLTDKIDSQTTGLVAIEGRITTYEPSPEYFYKKYSLVQAFENSLEHSKGNTYLTLNTKSNLQKTRTFQVSDSTVETNFIWLYIDWLRLDKYAILPQYLDNIDSNKFYGFGNGALTYKVIEPDEIVFVVGKAENGKLVPYDFGEEITSDAENISKGVLLAHSRGELLERFLDENDHFIFIFIFLAITFTIMSVKNFRHRLS